LDYNFLKNVILQTKWNYFSKSHTPLSWSGYSAYVSPPWKAYLTTTGYDMDN